MPTSAGGIVLAYVAFCASCNLIRTAYLRPIFHNDKKMYYVAPKRILWRKSSLSNDWSIFAFSVKFVCLLPWEKNEVWSHKNLKQKSSGQGLCFSPAFVMISCCLLFVFPSSCSCFVYFKKQEIDASEYIFQCCYLIHAGKVMKFWKMSLHNILAGVIGLCYQIIWGATKGTLGLILSYLVTGARLVSAYSFACYWLKTNILERKPQV